MADEITIEVCYALKEKQFIYQLKVPAGATIADAIRNSGVLEDCPEINLEQSKLGIYSKFRTLEDTVNQGDRIEIYRPLQADPKESRRERARKNK